MKNPLASLPFEAIHHAVAGERYEESNDPFLQEFIVDLPDIESINNDTPVEIITGEERIGRSTARFKGFLPEDINDQVPLYIAGGWLCSEDNLDQFAEEIAKTGKPVFTSSRESSLQLFADLHPAHLLDPVRALSQSLRATIDGVDRIAGSRGLDNSQLDVAGYSLGSHAAAQTAERQNERVRSLTLLAPPGLQEHSLPVFLSKRIPSFLLNELAGEIDITNAGSVADAIMAARGVARYIGRAPHKTLGEGIVAAQTDMRQRLETLREGGSKIAIVGALGDGLLPVGQTALQSLHLVDSLSVLPEPHTGHLFPIRHPRPTARLVRKAIDELSAPEPNLDPSWQAT